MRLALTSKVFFNPIIHTNYAISKILLVLIGLAVYIVVYGVNCISPLIFGASRRVFLASTSIALASIFVVFTMIPKLFVLYNKIVGVKETKVAAKMFFDDIGTPADRERLEKGTKEERLAVCSQHILIWHAMLAMAQKSSKGSSDAGDREKSKSQSKG